MILAAGLGTRMKSCRAKVLHELAGLPLVAHVVRAAFELAPEAIFTVVGHQAQEVEQAVRDQTARLVEAGMSALSELEFVTQSEQRGTGHAVMAARDRLTARRGPLVIIAGDAPLIEGSTLQHLVKTHRAEKNDATMLTVVMADPTGYGRIIRDKDGSLLRCVEQKDGSPEELAVREVGVSIYCFELPSLLGALDRLRADNAQGEYYLTDVPSIMQRQGKTVGLLCHSNAEEVLGVNTRIELADLERKLRDRKLRELMLSGVTIIDPATTYIHVDVEVGQDSVIHPQVIIEGRSRGRFRLRRSFLDPTEERPDRGQRNG
jgi:bifunctional UDP-N-acetylglucosamine pyrophosphorylase/glucosamine-1-phosphate N-acetyltransferase